MNLALVAALLTTASLTITSSADGLFGKIVSVTDGPIPGFLDAEFAVVPEFSGGYLNGLIELPLDSPPGNSVRTRAGALFDENGDLVWSNYVNVPPSAPSWTVVMGPVQGDTSKIGSIFVPELGKLHFGVANADTLSLDFAYEVDHGLEPSKAKFLSSSAISEFAFTFDWGTSVSLLTVDAAGNKLIDRYYHSPSFGSGTQWVSPIFNGDGNVTHLMVENLSGFTATRTLIRLTPNGDIVWSKQIQFPFSFSFQLRYFTAPDDAFIFYVDNPTSTILVKIDADGQEEWAWEIENFTLPAPRPSPDGKTIWFGGFRSLNLEDMKDTLAAGFDLETGELLGSFETTAGYDSLELFEVTNEEVFFFFERNDCEQFVGWTTTDLQSASVFERTDVLGSFRANYRDDACLSTSQFDWATSRLLFVTLDGNLKSGDSECPDFSPAEIALQDAGLIPIPYSPSLVDWDVTSTPAETSLTNTTLPLAVLPLDIVPCDYADFIPEKELLVAPSLTDDGTFLISLPSLKNQSHELLRFASLSGPPVVVDTKQGTGATLTFEVAGPPTGGTFFRVRSSPTIPE